ncbi:unnamed protein product [Blepharisma stoltei]|uniref:Nudix hydrolase domain-containing protein n=1 Tax=Blepharisma stoltei TaxID=1481888 RepID=A0AAU9KKM8_9CILI|nr:unnamed protein product [Blepharisma stoltei]
MSDRIPFQTHGFSLVVCRNFDGRWLAVKETRNRGWWLPAGLVDQGETFINAAYREVHEEAGVDVEIKGILRVEHSVYGPAHARMRVIFFAVPTDPSQFPKQIPDKESEEAKWVTIDELRKIARIPPGLRGPELYEWGNYIEKGGIIAPLSFLCREDEQTPPPQAAYFRLYEPISPKPDPGILIEAVEKRDIEEVRKCLLLGTEINIPINEKLWSPLHLACHLNHEEIVYLLLMSGADITMVTHKSRNIIHFAAQSTHQILSMVLVKASKCVSKMEIINHQDLVGDTPLHFAAAMSGRSKMWKELVTHGADPELRNNSGLSPTDML